MTGPQRHAVKVGVLTALIGASVIGSFAWVRETLIMRPEFTTHVRELETAHAAFLREAKINRYLLCTLTQSTDSFCLGPRP